MALNSLGLGFVFTARDMASGQIGNLARNFSGLDQAALRANNSYQRNLGALGVGAATLGAGVATLAGAFRMAEVAGEFQQQIAAIGAATRASDEDLRLLHDTAIQAGISTQFSPTEAAEGLQNLGTAGLNARQSAAALIPVLDLAAGSLGQLSVAGAGEAIVGTLNAYGMAVEDAGNVTDRLLRITQATNFTARDFEAGLSKAASSGATFGQDLNDVLITMGLLRNLNIEASSSATAYREAVRRMASDQGAQQAITSQGVDIYDRQTGRMRQLTDVMADFVTQTAGLTEEERNRAVVQAFGARGLLAYNAIANASFTTQENGAEVTLHGAAAVAAMNRELQNAGGTAESTRRRMQATFKGQRTLLEGSVQTLGVVMGEAFSPVFTPVFTALTNAANALIAVFNGMSEQMRSYVGNAVVAIGVVLTIAGAFITAGAAIAILGPFFASAMAAAGSLFVTLLPFLALFAAFAGAVYMLNAAVEDNVGGIGDTFRQLWADVSLVFSAIGQVIGQGYLSGEVAEEFSAASAGVQGFVETFHALYVRFQEFSAGISAGFDAAIGAMGPTLAAAGAAFDRLAEAMGFAGDVVDTAATTPLERFAAVGATVGAVIGDVLTWVLDFGRVLMDIASGAIAGFSEGWEASGVSLDALGEALSKAWDSIVKLGESLGIVNNGTSESASGWTTFGEVVGAVIGFVAGGIVDLAETAVVIFRVIVNVVRFVINIFVTLWETVKFIGQVIAAVFFGIRDSFMLVVDGLIAGLGRMAMALPEAVRPEWMNGLIRQGGAATARIETRANEASARADNIASTGRDILNFSGPSQEQERNRAREAELQAEATARALQGTGARREAARQQTTVIQVDGREIARAVSESGAIMSEESFTPPANMSMAPGV